MEFRRGDVVLIPFPYTDLSASKTRPAVVVSSDTYHATRSELLLAYVSSRTSQANPTIDYVLADWLAEKSVAAAVSFASAGDPGVDLGRLRGLLSTRLTSSL